MNKQRSFFENIERMLYKLISALFFPKKKRNKVRTNLFKAGILKVVYTALRCKFFKTKKYKYYLSVLACCKDEGDYIQEWVEYYLLQGVEHFYLYNNNGTDKSQELLKPYIEAGLITWIDWPGKCQQVNMYNDGIKRCRKETYWLAIVDLDEFIVPLNDKTLSQNMHEYEPYSQLLINWVIYGSSGLEKKEEGLVIERFTKHHDSVWPLMKSVVKPDYVVSADVHFCHVIGKMVDEHHLEQYGFGVSNPTVDILRVNHYVIKSKEEYAAKQKRGDPTKIDSDFTDEFFAFHDHNEIEDRELMQKYIPLIKENIKKRHIQ